MEPLLSVRPLVGEPGRFLVQSRTLFCSDTNGCQYSYQHRGDVVAKHASGDACPKCGQGKLEPTDYLVDLTLYAGLGRCACHRWQMHLSPLVSKMTPQEIQVVREADTYVCRHIQAARIFFACEQIDNINRRTWNRHRNRQQEGE